VTTVLYKPYDRHSHNLFYIPYLRHRQWVAEYYGISLGLRNKRRQFLNLACPDESGRIHGAAICVYASGFSGSRDAAPLD